MTRFKFHTLMLLGLVVLGSIPGMARAAESYDNCTGFITSLPAVIATQGTWCLKADLATAITSGIAISVNTNNVTIDCNNFKLGGLAAGAGTATWGIANTTQLNTTIRHCNIRGFYRGIYLAGAGGNIIEDNRLDGNTWIGIDTHGDGSVVRRNLVFDTGNSTTVFFSGAIPIITYDNTDIIDNTVSGAIALAGSNQGVYGILVQYNEAGTVSGNRIRDLVKDGSGVDVAIYSSVNGREHLHDNDLVGDNSTGSVAFQCDSVDARVRNNNISGFLDFYNTCGNAGGNDLAP